MPLLWQQCCKGGWQRFRHCTSQRVTSCLGVMKPDGLSNPSFSHKVSSGPLSPSPQSHNMPRNIPCLSCVPSATRAQELSTGERGHQEWQLDQEDLQVE